MTLRQAPTRASLRQAILVTLFTPLFGPDGNLYVNSYDTNQIVRFNGATGVSLGGFATVTSPSIMLFHDFGPTSSVSGTLTFEGIAGTAAARNVAFEFRSLSGTDHVVRLATVPPTGEFSVPTIPYQNYMLHVKGDKYLAANVNVNALNGITVSNVTALLGAGDADNNNIVDTSDFNALIGAFGGDASLPGSGYDETADFDGDGSVSTDDFNLLVGEFGNSGDP